MISLMLFSEVLHLIDCSSMDADLDADLAQQTFSSGLA